MKKIMFIIPSMHGGGSEKVMSVILEHLNNNQSPNFL